MKAEHETLVEGVAAFVWDYEQPDNFAMRSEEDVDKNEYRGAARAILALVYKTLSEPTEAMVEAWEKADPPPLASLNPFSPITAAEINRASATADLRAMLNASPLNGEE